MKDRDRETLDELLERLGIDEWDVLLVGDGSGTTGDRPAGWATISVERRTLERRLWIGAVNRGTVNFAEAMAYLHPLNALACREDERRRKGNGRFKRWLVHILTDSSYCAGAGASRGGSTTKHLGIWTGVESYARQGFILHWHHRGREDVELNRLADRLSRLARLEAEQYNLSGIAAKASGEEHEHNPDAKPRHR
jgi:hypothetical protein